MKRKECKQGKEKNENAQAPSTKARARPVTGALFVIRPEQHGRDKNPIQYVIGRRVVPQEEWERTVGNLPGGGAFSKRYQYHVHGGIPWNCFIRFSFFFPECAHPLPTPGPVIGTIWYP